MRRNYTRECDYAQQGMELMEKFKQKGYPSDLIQDGFDQFLAVPSPSQTNNQYGNGAHQGKNSVRFITGYTSEYKSITKIMKSTGTSSK